MAGISIPRIARPVLVRWPFVFSGICLWINLYVAPTAHCKNLKDSFFQVVTGNPTAAFTGDQVINDFPGQKNLHWQQERQRVGKRPRFLVESRTINPCKWSTPGPVSLETDLAAKQIKMKPGRQRVSSSAISPPPMT